MSNRFLFTGEESYSLQTLLTKRKEGFIHKHGSAGLSEFKGDSVDKSMIQNSLLGGGMFSTKKLVIIYGIPKENNASYKLPAGVQTPIEERIMNSRDRLDPEAIIVFICHKPDKRTKGRKFFEKHCEVKSFDPFKPNQAKKLITSTLGSLISNDQSTMIVDLVGTNVRNLTHECEKLLLYAEFHGLTSLNNEQIDSIIYHQGESNAFALLDTLFTDKDKSLAIIESLQQSQQDIFQTTGMLYRGLKIIIQIIDCMKKGIQSSKDIAKRIKAPPFAVAKQMKMGPHYVAHEKAITQFYSTIIKIDHSVKTGRLPAEGFRPVLKKTVYTLEL